VIGGGGDEKPAGAQSGIGRSGPETRGITVFHHFNVRSVV